MADDYLIPPLARWFEITTDYGDPVAKGPSAGEPHYAIDFGAPLGEPVFSMGPGTVLEPNANPEGVTGGNTITIDYGNGIIATFAHLDRMLVKAGDRVAAGQPIGTVGKSGIATGAHLHLDTWRHGRKINPLDLFDWTRETVGGGEYGTAFNLDAITKWLTESTAEDINKQTWGAYARGFNTDFVGGLAASKDLVRAIENLGWENRTIRAGDIPKVANELFLTGPLGDFESASGDDWGKAIVDFVGALVNPETWARVAAMILGFVMAAFGAYMIWSAT